MCVSSGVGGCVLVVEWEGVLVVEWEGGVLVVECEWEGVC